MKKCIVYKEKGVQSLPTLLIVNWPAVQWVKKYYPHPLEYSSLPFFVQFVFKYEGGK